MDGAIKLYGPRLPADLSALEWDDLVAIGRRVQTVSQWVLGDLAAAVQARYREGRLQAYASEVGVGHSTLQELRRVAKAYPEKSRRLDIPWSVYQVLAAWDDRLELVSGEPMTVAQAREIVASRGTVQARADAPHTGPGPGKSPHRRGDGGR